MDFVRSLIRSLLIASLVVLSLLLAPDAKADDCPGDGTCDQGVAFALCKAAVARTQQYFQSVNNGYNPIVTDCVHGQSSNGGGSYHCAVWKGYARCINADGSIDGQHFYYGSTGTCLSRNSSQLADAQPWYTEPSNCISGCQVYGERYNTTTGGVTVYGMRDRSYTGNVCTPSKPTEDIQQAHDEKTDATQEKSPECTALGQGQTACVKPNGDYCATASTGSTFCWSATETGKKSDGKEAQVKDKADQPVTPPTTPPDSANLEWQRTQGHQKTACVNSTCTTYNVTNYTSVPTGQAKNSTAPNDPTGSTNTSGNGKPPGTPNGNGNDDDGEGETGTPGSDDCQRVPTCSNGDSIGCAMLRQHHAMSCRISDEGGYTSDTEAGQGQAAPSTAIVYGDGELSSLLNNINLDGWAAPGRCPVVLQFNALGRSYTMDNEHFCQILQALAALINIVAAIHAGFIITGGRR